jgi:hypothetical protein
MVDCNFIVSSSISQCLAGWSIFSLFPTFGNDFCIGGFVGVYLLRQFHLVVKSSLKLCNFCIFPDALSAI